MLFRQLSEDTISKKEVLTERNKRYFGCRRYRNLEAGLCLAAELTASQIAQTSNRAGGLVCKSMGVVPVNSEELAAEIKKL